MNKRFPKIKKAVIALAGYGTRFLPATKNQPKQMLPIIDKPIVHYVVEEAVNSGIEKTLEETGKYDYLKIVREIPQMANFIYVRQKKHLPYGNGTPLLSVAPLI